MIRLDHLRRIALLLSVALLSAIPIRADQTIEVGYRGCELADAIQAANTNQPVGNCRGGDPGHDHIFVDGVVPVQENPAPITEDLTVVGDRDTSTLDGQGRFPFLHLGPGVNVNIQDILLSNGYGTPELGQVRVDSGGRVGFNTASIINCKGVKDVVAAEDSEVHIGYAASICGRTGPYSQRPRVVPPSSSTSKRRSTGDAAKRVSRPVRYTCEHLPESIVVRPFAGTRNGIQCQALDEAGVGLQSVIDLGIIAAVDIWNVVEPGAEVCLQGRGSLIFLDAADAPRVPSRMPSYPKGGMTCASFDRAGSLVLVEPAA